MTLMRSLLFVPANRPNMIARARELPADVLVLDLEDSVPPAEKQSAREALPEAIAGLKAAGKTVHVRVNSMDTGLTRDDLAAAVVAGLDGVVLPKVAAARDIRQFDVMIREQELKHELRPGDIELVPHIESAAGLMRGEEIAQASSRIRALSLGFEDYARDLGVPRSREGVELDYGRRLLVHIAVAHGLIPLDGVFPDFSDTEGLAAEAAYARRIGYKGKYVIHPSQIEPVNQAFVPSEAELAEARRIVAAFDEAVAQGRASVRLDGRMIDTPVARRARDLLGE
jgi:citrate lyase subunit beta/citryl-CoA lyase